MIATNSAWITEQREERECALRWASCLTVFVGFACLTPIPTTNKCAHGQLGTTISNISVCHTLMCDLYFDCWFCHFFLLILFFYEYIFLYKNTVTEECVKPLTKKGVTKLFPYIFYWKLIFILHFCLSTFYFLFCNDIKLHDYLFNEGQNVWRIVLYFHITTK